MRAYVDVNFTFSLQECERWGGGCCNQKTCKLHPGKECDSGACCENCTVYDWATVPFSNQYVSLLDKTPWVRVCHLNSRKVSMHLVSLVRDI